MEPLTPMGRLCLQPEHNHVIHCAIGLKNPIDIDNLKDVISNSIVFKIPRFSSLLILNPYDGSQSWKRTQVNIDDHIFFHHEDYEQEHPLSDEDIINSYLADIAISPPMSLDKPLWELHILPEQKCLVMRVHHALADGVSLMSMLWTIGKSRGEHDENPVVNGRHGNNGKVMSSVNGHANNHDVGQGKKKSMKKKGLWETLMFVWFSLVFGLKFVARCLWVKDKGKVISGIEGVELWPRKMATATFSLGDMKTIKKAIPNATIHDILYGIVWCGLTRYLNARYPQALKNGTQITGMCPVNLRQEPGLQDLSIMLTNSSKRWGNKFSVILLPIIYHKQRELDSLTYVARAKSLMDQKKRSTEARLSYEAVNTASALFGSKVGSFLYYKLFCNTSFLLSNIPGPQEEISIGGNPVTFIRATASSQPHAITMHLVSYVGRADLQIQVAKDVIPDPKFLAKCFEDALAEMKKSTNNEPANI